jgi:hypothetical protein
MGSGSLLAPAGLALLGLLAPLIVLYILKIKRQRLRVASTWLWAVAQRDLMARTPFKKLIAQIPLLLQAAALCALAVALARPATRGRQIMGDHLAILIDTSASMSAVVSQGEPPVRRIDLARQVARDLLSSLTPGSDALLLEAGRDARLIAPLDRDMVRLKAAVDGIAARDVEGAAVALAVDRLRQLGGSRKIVVITDGNLATPSSLSGAALPMEVITVGAPAENAAIVRVDVRSGIDPAAAREQVQGFLVVANFGTQPRDMYVTMRQENASDVLASRRVLVGPGERQPVILTFHPSPGDYRKGLLFEIAPHDAMEVDDIAYARVPAGDKLPVFLASATAGEPPSPWLERALAADPTTAVRVGSLADLSAAGAVEMDTFVVVDGACPPNPPGGDLLIVNPPAGRCFGTTVGASIDRPLLTSWETADPRMRFLSLDGVMIRKASALKPDGKAQELIRAQEGAIATDISTPARTATLLGFDVGESDWPLKASFVLFMRNLLEQARTHRSHGITGPARAGEPLRASIAVSAKDVRVEGPDGRPLDVSLRGGLAVVPEISHIGFYRISWQGTQAGSTIVPANLTSVAESNLSTKLPAMDGQKVAVTASGAQPDAHQEWTWLLALVALGLIVFDVWYFTHKPSVPKALPALDPRPRIPERKAS